MLFRQEQKPLGVKELMSTCRCRRESNNAKSQRNIAPPDGLLQAFHCFKEVSEKKNRE